MASVHGKRCGAVLHWRQLQGILVWTATHGYEARCPSCNAIVHQVRLPRPGQKCPALHMTKFE
jgi:hypothetical protein